MKKVTLFCAITFLFIGISFGQKKPGLKYVPSIGLHGGVMSYLGDVRGAEGTNIFSYAKPTYGFYLEKKIGSIFGVSVNGIFGKVSKSQLDDEIFLNFESKIMTFDLNLLLDFDNGKVINESSLFSPFLSFGIGYLSFDPKGDLSKNGVLYNHWDDGTIRDVAQSTPGSDTASTILTRDYDYESSLKDSTTNYPKTAITIPIRFGLKFELSEHIDARISAAYIITTTDFIDNVSGGGNDNLFYTSFGLQYNFSGGGNNENDRFKDFDFSDLDKEDSDNDGVPDHKDLCQDTPKDIKVDNKGCALDGDNDGVADYKDKELNTSPGALVNREGVTLTDEMIAKQESLKDFVATKYRVFKAQDLSEDDIDAIQRQYAKANNTSSIGSEVNIPESFKGLDIDKDNYVSAKEVTNAIDGFFEGKNNLSAKDLNKLIDFYFDQ